MFRSLNVRWRLAGAFFLVILVLVSLVGLYLLEWTESYYTRSISDDLKRESRAIARFVQAAATGDMPDVVTWMGHDLNHRITIIKPDGTVIADSEHDYRKMQNHSNRPEIKQAFKTGYGTTTRYSVTLRTRMLYVATKYVRGGKTIGVVRVAEPLSGLKEVMSTIQRTFLAAAFAAILLAAILSVKLASSITTPIASISSAARRLAQGDLSARTNAPEKPTEEMGALALTFNNMAEQLQVMVRELNEQKARMQTIFDKADDGLMLVDSGGVIHMINPAACRMLGTNCADAIGRTVIEGTLSHDLAGLVDRAISNREPAALDITLSNKEEAAIHAYVAPVTTAQQSVNALVVLHDVTASRRLDAVRRDFVANVSHELRTPLASIKAMAETILLRHNSDPSAVPQFAQNIVTESDRMTLLAEELLDLAKVESGRRMLDPQKENLKNLVYDVFDRLKIASGRRSIELISEVAEDEVIQADCDSVHQILMNLVDNAIKYSGDGGKVVVSARHDQGSIVIRVSDNGIGIPQEDLPRIFERFYRVDKARSRQSGGTGLGLSIVKHLTELMGGSVSVISEPGKGTTFSIAIPED